MSRKKFIDEEEDHESSSNVNLLNSKGKWPGENSSNKIEVNDSNIVLAEKVDKITKPKVLI